MSRLQVSGGPAGLCPSFPACGGVSLPAGRFPALTLPLLAFSKTALLEGLEVDQYMLGILIYIQK